MEAILPFDTLDREKFYASALEVGFDELVAYKFIYTIQDSDLDVYPLMGEERLSLLLYGWELCDDYMQDAKNVTGELPPALSLVLKMLLPHTLGTWLSKEWEKCKPVFKIGLIHCINRARQLIARIPKFETIDWDYWLQLNMKPWSVPYLLNLHATLKKPLEAQYVETVEDPATVDDVNYLMQEKLLLVLLRLIKLFDGGSMEMVKALSMRIIAAWNQIYDQQLEDVVGNDLPHIPAEDKRCLILICHIYLMAVYETDDVRGYAIDNMMNNIRFYYGGILAQVDSANYAPDDLEFTPARFIALTCVNLGLKKREFFESFITDSYDTCLVTLFGVVSQAYKSYLIGNLLMELNNMNEQDFVAHLGLFKRLINLYVIERERSELFMLGEMRKQDAQRYSHNVTQTIKDMTDFKSKICKGNRMSNIGNYENCDDINDEEMLDQKNPIERDEESDRRLDPIFQNIPNHENTLYYVYDVLAKRSYKGWHFAKIVLLLKIIGQELNAIETWRYHPGLTTDFMLNLETELSHHYEDLAKIFEDYPFLEQEFWLTAFYLHPTPKLYDHVLRCGMRFNRRRHQAEGNDENVKAAHHNDKMDNAKFGLLSSTIEVTEIVVLTNNETLSSDYESLLSALRSLRLPDSVVKDLLTVIFLPRNKSLAWAVNWHELLKRCKILLKNKAEKRRCVELNMAEANDRLKFLKIDYEKYKNRPQLDYGTIEEGYENLVNVTEYAGNSGDEDDDYFEETEDVFANYASKSGEFVSDDNSTNSDQDYYYSGTRRTRTRTAAAVATALMFGYERPRKTKDDKQIDSKATPSLPNEGGSNSAEAPTEPVNIPKRSLREWLKDRPIYTNDTRGFKPLTDIWNIDSSELEKIDKNSVALLESGRILRGYAQLKTVQNPGERGDLESITYEICNVHTCSPSAESQQASNPTENDPHSKTLTNSSTNSDVKILLDQEGNCGVEVNSDEDSAGITESQQFSKGSRPMQNTNNVKQQQEQADAFNAKESHTEEVIRNGTLNVDISKREQLKTECRENQLFVALHKLTVSELRPLRQPKVLLKRLNIEQYSEETATKRKRTQYRVSDDSDESGKTSQSYKSDSSSDQSFVKTKSERRRMKRERGSSESSESTDSEEYKSQGHQSRRPPYRRRRNTSGFSGRRACRSSNMVVTPRSASGLKLRISSVGPISTPTTTPTSPTPTPTPIAIRRHEAAVINFVQVSFSSSDSVDVKRSGSLSPVAEIEEAGLTEDPLYEEEIIPFS